MKKILALALCLMIALLPVCAMALKIPKNPVPTAEPAPAYEEDDNNNTTGDEDPGFKWVSLRGDYEFIVPTDFLEKYDDSPMEDGMQMYYTAIGTRGMKAVAAIAMTGMDGILLNKDLAGFILEEGGMERLTNHYIDPPMETDFFIMQDDEGTAIFAVFDGVDAPGCHMLMFVSDDIERFVEEYVEDCMQNIRKI